VQVRQLSTLDLYPGAAVRRHPGRGVVEQHVQIGLAGARLAALSADDPGGRLRAAEQLAAALVAVGPAGMVTGGSGWLLGDIRVHQPAPIVGERAR
jgi:hypothetical protein